MSKVRVIANPMRKSQPDKPWFVYCDHCSGRDKGDTFAWLFDGPLGYARSWRHAQDYAATHAMAHESTRCTACLHVPARPLQEAKP